MHNVLYVLCFNSQLWEVYNNRRLLRTFLGHGKAVRDISFNNDGSKFLSCSYDRYIKVWDTETGTFIFNTLKLMHCYDHFNNNVHLFVHVQMYLYGWIVVTYMYIHVHCTCNRKVQTLLLYMYMH